MRHKLPLGLLNGVLVEAHQVESGLKCGCVCAHCGAELVARKGRIKQHHFAHHNAPECKYGLESALHLAAKQIIEQEKKFRIPTLYKKIDGQFIKDALGEDQNLIFEYGSYYPLIKERTFDVNVVHLEKKFHDFVPDIILEAGSTKLIVEIAVTHFIDDIKLAKIKEANVSVIEINLSEFYGNFSIAQLKKLLINQTEFKRWVHNSKSDQIWQHKCNGEAENFRKRNLKEIDKRDERLAVQERHWKLLAEEAEKKAEEERKKREKKEEFYKKYYKPIIERTIYRDWDDEKVPIYLKHVEPCPLNKKRFYDSFYANYDTDCKRCQYNRGVRRGESCVNLICLGEYYKSKDDKSDVDLIIQ